LAGEKVGIKFVLMGIGNELKGDDGIGNIIAREFKHPDWLPLACETVAENFVAVVEREKPELLAIVDAADMGLQPGEFRLLPKKKLNSVAFTTHSMPLRHLVEHLEKSAGKILFIGVQPGKTGLGEGLSSDLEKSKKELIEILQKKDWHKIEEL